MGRLGVGVEWGEEWGGELLGMKERERIYIYMGCGVVFDFFSFFFLWQGVDFFFFFFGKRIDSLFFFQSKKDV